jgi:hypothetical protein
MHRHNGDRNSFSILISSNAPAQWRPERIHNRHQPIFNLIAIISGIISPESLALYHRNGWHNGNRIIHTTRSGLNILIINRHFMFPRKVNPLRRHYKFKGSLINNFLKNIALFLMHSHLTANYCRG